MTALVTQCEPWCNSHPGDVDYCTRRTLRSTPGMGVDVDNDDSIATGPTRTLAIRAFIDLDSVTPDQARAFAAALIRAAGTAETV